MTSAELAETVASCMRERGFHVEVDDEGFLVLNFTNDQRESILEAEDDCVAAMIEQGLLPEPGPLSDEQLSVLYNDLLVVDACMRDLGIDLPQPPTRETYVESGGADWHPHALIPTGSSFEKVQQIIEKCPQGG